MNLLKKLLSSLESGRKLSALVGVLTAIYVTAAKITTAEALSALYAWLVYSLICLGIVTIEQVIEIRNGITKEKEIQP